MIYVYFFIKCVVRWSENSVRFEKSYGNWLPNGPNSVRFYLAQCEIWHVCRGSPSEVYIYYFIQNCSSEFVCLCKSCSKLTKVCMPVKRYFVIYMYHIVWITHMHIFIVIICDNHYTILCAVNIVCVHKLYFNNWIAKGTITYSPKLCIFIHNV